MQNKSAMAPKLNGRLVTNAIRRLGGSSGSTIVEIKKYLQNVKKLDCDAGSLKLYLKNAIERGNLSLLDGKYKVNETARRRRRSSGSRRRRRSSGSRRKSSRRSGSRRRSRKRSGSRRRRRSRKAAEAAEAESIYAAEAE